MAGPVGQLQPGDLARLRLHGHHRGVPRPPHPVGILIAGLFLALTFIGGESAQIALKVPLDLTKVFQGILLFYVLACDTLILYRIRVIRAPAPPAKAALTMELA